MRSAATQTNSGGAFSMTARHMSRISLAESARQAIAPAITWVQPDRAILETRHDAEFSPPPRSPQNRSVFSFSLARTMRPSAVTTSTDETLSEVQPKLAGKVTESAAEGEARDPCGRDEAKHGSKAVYLGSRWTSPRRHPAWARAVRELGWTHTPRIRDMSSINPPSHTASPAMLWPPPFIDNATPCSRAKLTRATTSATPRQRAMSAGRRSIMAFQIERVSSYPGSLARISSPRRLSLNFRMVSSFRVTSPLVRALTCKSTCLPPLSVKHSTHGAVIDCCASYTACSGAQTLRLHPVDFVDADGVIETFGCHFS